jgi:hypothetical protein
MRPKLKEPEGLTPVAITAPAVVGNDPYGAGDAVAKMLQMAKVGNAQAPLVTTSEVPAPDPAVPKAPTAPVPVVVPPVPSSDVKLDQPEPIKFN